MFPYSECLHATIKDTSQCITCIDIKPNNMVHVRFDLSFCDEFPEYNVPSEELDDVPNASIIHFSVYTYQGRCETRGIVPNESSVCRSSE